VRCADDHRRQYGLAGSAAIALLVLPIIREPLWH
jgi:hypothetical protein